MPIFGKMGKKGSKMGFFKVFQLFLKIGSKDFSGFLSKVRGQYGLKTGKDRFFTENAHFWVNGPKVVKNRFFQGFSTFSQNRLQGFS